MIEPTYVYPDQVMAALDIKPSTYMMAEVLRACRAGSRATESLVKRFLYPMTKTISFDWPSVTYRYAVPERIDFNAWALISPTSVVSNGVTIPSNAYFLEPNAYGPPYDHLDMDRNSSSAFAGGPQRAVAITGLWGWTNDELAASTLNASILAADTTVVTTTPVPVGAILRIGTERLQVLANAFVSSTQTASALAADKAVISITVADGTKFTPNERLLIDSERMRITDIAGNVLTVARAIEGSVLAVHSGGASIFWQHSNTVERGSLGTTAAAASGGAAVYQWCAPSLAAELAQAYAEDAFLQRNSGYARTIGSSEATQNVSTQGIKNIEARARRQFKRLRTAAV